MSKITTFISLCKDKKALKKAFMENFSRSKISHLLSDKVFLSLQFSFFFGYKLNLKSPQTFNEKLQWLKLYNRNSQYTSMVDKYIGKQFVSRVIGEQFTIPTFGVWDRFEDIDFDFLPNQFVLKCTHDSGCVVICKNKKDFDKAAAKQKLEKSLARSFYYYSREWPYKGVPRKIIAEKYMEDKTFHELRDYKFFCFGGQVKCFKVDFDRFIDHHANYFDRDGNLLKFGEVVCPPVYDRKIELPKTLKKMIELAEKLSTGIPFLRVDFYEVNGKIYFGELTFFPASGLGEFIPQEWDLKLGEWITLPIT